MAEVFSNLKIIRYGIYLVYNKSTIGRWFLPGVILISSIILLVVGVPRFLAELMLVPGTQIYERILLGKQLNDEDLTVLEHSRLQALEFVKLPRAYTDLGTSYLARAQRAGSAVERLKYAERAVELTTKGLELAPLNTFAWSRLSLAHILLGSAHYEDALVTWRVSVSTARYEPFLLIQRLHIGIILYQLMTLEDRELLNDQFQLAYNWNRKKMRTYARENQLMPWMAYFVREDAEAKNYFSS